MTTIYGSDSSTPFGSSSGTSGSILSGSGSQLSHSIFKTIGTTTRIAPNTNTHSYCCCNGLDIALFIIIIVMVITLCYIGCCTGVGMSK